MCLFLLTHVKDSQCSDVFIDGFMCGGWRYSKPELKGMRRESEIRQGGYIALEHKTNHTRYLVLLHLELSTETLPKDQTWCFSYSCERLCSRSFIVEPKHNWRWGTWCGFTPRWSSWWLNQGAKIQVWILTLFTQIRLNCRCLLDLIRKILYVNMAF